MSARLAGMSVLCVQSQRLYLLYHTGLSVGEEEVDIVMVGSLNLCLLSDKLGKGKEGRKGHSVIFFVLASNACTLYSEMGI